MDTNVPPSSQTSTPPVQVTPPPSMGVGPSNTTSTPPQSNGMPPKPFPKWVLPTIIAAIVLLVVGSVGILIAKYVIKPSPKQNVVATNAKSLTQHEISGFIDLNGVPPQGSTIYIGQRKVGAEKFDIVVSALEANDGASWDWNGSQMGTAYELQAYLMNNGSVIAKSPILTAVAPADSEILRLNIATEQPSVSPAPSPAATPQSAGVIYSAVSGTFNLNGYIPPNSTITLMARNLGSPTFTVVQSGIAATDNGSWTWAAAQQNVAYEMQAVLVANGNNATQSQIIQVVAPATNEVLSINSPLAAPAPQAVSISGSFNINGTYPGGSTISLGQRKTGTSQFSIVATNIAASDGSTWIWNQATSGTSYDLQAYLMNNGSNVAQSQILTVAAPATGETLTINAQTQPSAPPSGSMTNRCVGKNNSNQWQVQFTYNNNSVINNAQQFQLSAGTSTGDNSMVNVTTSPSNPNQSQTYTSDFLFNTGQTYFAQWSYATCANCGTFSKNSPSLQFYCNVQPTNTPTPTPTSTP